MPDREALELQNFFTGDYAPGKDGNMLYASVDGKNVAEDASASFATADFTTGNLTLTNFFDNYPSIKIEGFALNTEKEGDYSRLTFSGTATAEDTFSFSYSGYIVFGNLHVEISTK